MSATEPTTAFREAARAYADGVQALLAPVAPPTRPPERSPERGAAPAAVLAERAERLAPLSERYTRDAAAGLAAPDPAIRTQVATGLLAKALTDLEVGVALLEAAEDEEAGIGPSAGREAERSLARAGGGLDEERRRLLLGEIAAAPEGPERGAAPPPDLPTARLTLGDAVEDALAIVGERAGRAGQAALAGLLGLGVAEVAQAAGLVGRGLAEALGQGERLGRLYDLGRAFALQAYGSLLALLGPSLAKSAAEQVLAWVDELKGSKLVGALVDRLYQTERTVDDLRRLVDSSPAGLDRFVAAIAGVEELAAAYRRQLDLADRLLTGLRYVGTAIAVLPQGRLLVAAAYIVLWAYVTLAGADYADAPQLRWLDRVPGVRRTVELHLAGA